MILLDLEFSSRLCLTLVHSLWQIPALVLVVWTVGRLGRRSVDWSYNLYVTAMIAGLLAMPTTYFLLEVRAPQTRIADHHPLSVSDPIDGVASLLPLEVRANQPMLAAAETEQIVEPDNGSGVAYRVSRHWTLLTPWFALAYAVGVLAMLARLGFGILYAHRLASRSEPLIEGPLLERFHSLTHRFSTRVMPVLAQAEHVVVPKVVGLLRPAILLPSSAVTALPPDVLEIVVMHELSHLRRYDMWVNLLQRLAEGVLFFNPALWYLSRRISTLREYCCDELTCRTISATQADPRTRYAVALLRIAELCNAGLVDRSLGGHSTLATLATSGHSPSDLRRRVARLFNEPLQEPLPTSRGVLLLLATVALLLLTGPMVWHASVDAASAQATSSQQQSESRSAAQSTETAAREEREAKDAESTAPASSNVNLDEICAAWSARSQRIVNAHIQWKGLFTTTTFGTFPHEDETKSRCSKELKWAGRDMSRVYYSFDRLTRGRSGGPEPLLYKIASDSAHNRRLMQFPWAGYTEGTISSLGGVHSHVRDVELKPIILNFHALSPKMGGYERRELKLSDRKDVIDGVDCLMVEVGFDSEIWVSPTRDFVVKRYISRDRDGDTICEVDIDCKHDAKVGWIPASWKIASYHIGGTNSTFDETVTQYAFNQGIANSEFHIQFPSGAFVQDFSGEETQSWTVRPDGTREHLGKEEVVAVYLKLSKKLRTPLSDR